MSKYPIEGLGFAANPNGELDVTDPVEALIMAATSDFIPKTGNLKVKSELLRYDGKETTCNVVYLNKHPYQVGWIKDADVKACMACASSFNFFKRKHHCRKCGFVVCNSCSQDRLRIPEILVSEPKGSRVCTSCSHQHYLDSKRKVDAIKEADPNSLEALLEKWKSVTKNDNTAAVDGLSKEQLKETIGNACAKIMEDICAGTAFPASHPIVEVKVQHFNFLGVSRSWNRVFLTGTKYNIGWVFYRDYTKCMVCTADFMNTVKPIQRTHCRMCGFMICTKCASNKILISEFLETDGSDCCLKCFNGLKPKDTEDAPENAEATPNATPSGAETDAKEESTPNPLGPDATVEAPPASTAPASATEEPAPAPESPVSGGGGGVSPAKKVDKNQAMIDKLSKLNASFN